jgi:hypothetical protein
MDKNPLNRGVLTRNSAEIGPVTHAMVQARARELAVVAGRAPAHVSPADLEQARRELAGGPEMDSRETSMDSIPEAKRWDPVPGSSGRQGAESPSEDEDEEGRSETEQLVEEGVEEAGRDRMLEAARAAEKKDLRER